jgi:hypothetical protein
MDREGFPEKKQMQTATREQRIAAGRIAGLASARKRASQAAANKRLRVQRLKARRQQIEDDLLARVAQLTGNVLR